MPTRRMKATGFCELLIHLAVYAILSAVTAASNSNPRLLIVSLDGFRYDYLQMYEAPHLKELASEGVIAPRGMIPSFPTVTFPNHYTLVTGLYPESHGIVYNTMYDPDYNDYFAYGNESKWWNDTSPIWISATKQGLKTGVAFWPGSTVVIDNTTANFYLGWKDDDPFDNRVNALIDWFVNKNIDLGVIYFEQPDGQGHKFGPLSTEVREMVKTMDNIIGRLVGELKNHSLYDKMNIIVTSDHGMSNVTKDESRVLILSKYLNPEEYMNVTQKGAVGAIMVKPEQLENVFNKLNNANPNVTIYRKKDIPDRYHYKKHRRIMPIVAIADEGFYVAKDEDDWAKASIGVHGYDNQLMTMRPIFIARGPSFKKNLELAPFENVDVYPLMCKLLKIKPHPCNGTVKTFDSVLISKAMYHSISFCCLLASCLLTFICKLSLLM